jgi:hypothetical protein
MVVTSRPSRPPMGSWQERTGSPFRCTVQAPHWAMPQPNLVPVMPSVSRSTQRRGVRLANRVAAPGRGRVVGSLRRIPPLFPWPKTEEFP